MPNSKTNQYLLTEMNNLNYQKRCLHLVGPQLQHAANNLKPLEKKKKKKMISVIKGGIIRL